MILYFQNYSLMGWNLSSTTQKNKVYLIWSNKKRAFKLMLGTAICSLCNLLNSKKKIISLPCSFGGRKEINPTVAIWLLSVHFQTPDLQVGETNTQLPGVIVMAAMVKHWDWSQRFIVRTKDTGQNPCNKCFTEKYLRLSIHEDDGIPTKSSNTVQVWVNLVLDIQSTMQLNVSLI